MRSSSSACIAAPARRNADAATASVDVCGAEVDDAATGTSSAADRRRQFTTIGPRRTPTRWRSTSVVSSSSFTGVVSGTVTSTTWHLAGSPSSVTDLVGLGAHGSALRTVRAGRTADVRNVTACPAAGPSTDDQSQSPLRSSCLILPRTTRSSMPGAAVPTTSITPLAVQALGDHPKPCSCRYSSSASAAEIDSTSRSGTSCSRPACRRARREHPRPASAAGGPGLPIPWSSRRPLCRPRSRAS